MQKRDRKEQKIILDLTSFLYIIYIGIHLTFAFLKMYINVILFKDLSIFKTSVFWRL